MNENGAFGRRARWSGLVGLFAAAVMLVVRCVPPDGGATTAGEPVARSSCAQCHQPLADDGTVTGLEDAHAVAELACVDCHGGNPDDITVAGAHVPPRGSPAFLKNLTSLELDAVDQDYLRFINPGDLRVVSKTCGRCHAEEVARVRNSMMSHTSGEITVARYRAGAQDTELSLFGATDLVDPNFDASIPTTVASLDLFNPDPLVGDARFDYGRVQDHYMESACFRCHFGDFGENKFKGDFRSGGCSACHMPYANDGLSQSGDALLDHDRPPHPIKHEITKAIPVEQCTHCHYRGGRLGIAFQGYRESGGSGFDPTNTATLGVDLHGHDVNYYITDENADNDYDETPPDVHFEAGMACIDCHTLFDIHGDGHLYSDTPAAVEIRCVSCHGTIDEKASLLTSRGRALTNVERDAEGELWLTGKLDGVKHRVPQVFDSVDADSAHYSAAAAVAHGRDADGFSHTESLECYTCHASWLPSCYGCHVTVDYTGTARSLVTGTIEPGRATGKRKWVVTDDLVLMVDQRGLIAPSQPSERFFLTIIDEDGETVLDSMPRSGQHGAPGMGQRAYNPHTTRKQSPFSACDRCHPNADASNMDTVDVVCGFGSERYLETDGTGKVWRLDQIQTRDYEPLVTVGHNEPIEMRPLPREVVERMLSVTIDTNND